jgi:glycosyltransferase involved in cell wall biosynthesis
MKIAVLDNQNIFKASSASANRWRTMLEGLAKHGVEVHLIVTQGYQSMAEYREFKKHGVIGGIHCHYTVFLLRSGLWQRRLVKYVLSPMLAGLNRRRVSMLLNHLSPDILFLHPSSAICDMYARIYPEKTDVFKLMIELSEFNDTAHTRTTNKLQLADTEKRNELLTKKILPDTDLFVIMTRRLIEHYRSLAGNTGAKYLHLPMTVDLARFKDVQPVALRVPYIAYIGALNNKKDGIDVLIESFARIAQVHDELTLYLVGGYQHDVDIQKDLIAKFSLEDKVVYLGEKTRDEIPPILMNAELLVLPRPDSRQAQGGFPTKLGEYLASGNPVCATRVGEIPDYLADNVSVFFAEPGNVESFTDAMLRALSNKAAAKIVGENGRKVAEKKFNMDVQAQILFDFLESNLEGKNRYV